MMFKYSNLSIYNQEELANKLNIDMWYSEKDLLLKVYHTWGENFLNEINGDFAFALYDYTKGEIFAARDPLGIKALYYVSANEQYYFSENIDELFQLSGIEKKPNIRSMRTLLNKRAVDYEETMYEGIKRVPPGHYIKVLQGKVTLTRYWFPEKIETDYTISLKDAAIKFSQLFENAIFSRLGEDEKTAYELSGGLDSSSIVSMVKTRYPQKKIDTYSMCFEGLECDEYPYIRSVEEKFDFHSVKVEAGEIDYKNKYDHNFNYRMSPHWPVILTFSMNFPMVEKMKRDGKQIIITGQGGDHLLSGNCYVVADLLERSEYGKILDQLTQTLHISLRYLDCTVLSILSRKQKDLIKSVFQLLRVKNKRRNDEHDKIADLFHFRDIVSSSKRADISVLVSAAQSTIMDGNIFHAIENVSHVEYRHPFFDKDLVEYVLSLPPEYKFSKGWIKVLLRISMDSILPEKIRSRSDKAVFSEVLVRQLNMIDIRKILHNSNLVSLGLITQKEIDKLIRLFEKGKYNHILYLWTIVNLENWHKNILDEKY